jgi:DNA-binding MarR family transcriptional regulator
VRPARASAQTDPPTEALETFLKAHRVLFEALDGELRDRVGLSIPQLEMLQALSQAPEGRLRMMDITKQMCVSKSGVTQLVDRLEERGLVARVFSRSDRRLTYATLTEAGTEACERAWPAFHEAARTHLARHLSDKDLRCLHTALSKVLEGRG